MNDPRLAPTLVPGDYADELEKVVDVLGEAAPPMTAYFDAIQTGLRNAGLGPECRRPCEPGRELVASACSNAVSIRFDGVFPGRFVTVVSPPLLP